ncbi:unnamed protein product [Hanseniaspora opuntiae]
MLKNIVSAYTSSYSVKDSKPKESQVTDIDHDIKKLLFNKKLLVKFIYKRQHVTISLRNNSKIVYFIDMLSKLLNFEHNVDINKIQFLLENKYNLKGFQHYYIVDLFSLYKKEITFNELNKDKEVYEVYIDFHGSPDVYNSIDLVKVEDYDIKNASRLNFFEDWKQATHIMFNSSKKILKMTVNDSDDLWNSYFFPSDDINNNKFHNVITKNKLILLEKKVPCRILYLHDDKLVMRQPIAEPECTLEDLFSKIDTNNNPYVVQIQGIHIENLGFKVKELYDIFHSPNGFLYISLANRHKS